MARIIFIEVIFILASPSAAPKPVSLAVDFSDLMRFFRVPGPGFLPHISSGLPFRNLASDPPLKQDGHVLQLKMTFSLSEVEGGLKIDAAVRCGGTEKTS